MTRLIELLSAPALVDVQFLGPVSFTDRLELLDEVRPLVEAQGLKGVLLDYTRAWVGESSATAFEALEAGLREASWLAGLRVALVSPAEFHAVPLESLGRELGYEIRRFYTRGAAIDWLARREA